MSKWKDKAEGLEADLGSALDILGRVARGETTERRVAWWLAANYRRYVVGDDRIEAQAAAHGDPPRGTWSEWWAAARIQQ